MTKPHPPVADPQLLDYYTRELIYMRALALEFAQQHPKIAARLGMQAGEIGDPYVERLVQASSFMTARTQMRIDAAFPELMQPMLETVYPNYVRQTPAIGVARLYPGHDSGHLGQGFLIPRGTAFTSHTPTGENTPCIFRSSQDVTVYPLRIRLARVTMIPPDIPSLGLYVPDGQPVRGAVRLTLETTHGASIANLEDLDRLPLYLAGDERIASHLFELIHAAGIATVMAAPGRFADGPLYGVAHDAVVHEGIDPEQAVLPDVPRPLHGHGLMQEYFACPARFWFLALTGLARGLKAIEGNAVEIVILLNRAPGALADAVEGFELATEAHGVARANQGMLITTEPRAGAGAPVKDMGETVQRLTQARELHEGLADLAQQNQAQDHGADQSDVAKAIKAQNEEIRGLGGKSADGKFPELARPHLILASPVGIETTSAQSTHIASTEHIALTSGQHLSLSAGGRLLASVTKGVRLFCQKAGIKLVAAGGDIDLKALADSVNILAKLNITQTANRITITAKEELHSSRRVSREVSRFT
ncbi:type VI secretion system baseplate subunit TssF [Paraburkholderia sp. MPAMCS5]|uniref:type VI secretion system baseplate subunit TssF n=1 Tax=Paraburkholderia sp. MPAMCS5 TaxID=3112563 RepID=UPI002E1895A8|nr:type VI secretion system baseplate subunit TssF [Paraburkholderia sp. MPAMCS5]